MFRLKDERAQSTLEYAVIIAVIVGALIAMQVYIKRGIQGRFREASDQIGEQFSPDTSTYNYTTTSNSAQTENLLSGETTTNITKGSQNRTGTETVGTLSSEGGGAASGAPAATAPAGNAT